VIVATFARPSPNVAAYPVVVTTTDFDDVDDIDATKDLLVREEENLFLLATTEARHRIRRLFQLPENWDGYGSTKPDFNAIVRAYLALRKMFQTASLSGYGWTNPNVSADESGAVVFEWWRGGYKLTVYVTANEMSYVRVWGDDMDTEMEDGEIDSIGYDFSALWGWLNS
jgi:hypothetical protein